MINLSVITGMIPQPEFKALVGLIVLIFFNFILGVILATKSGEFDSKKLPNVLQSMMLYIGGLVLLFIFGMYLPYLMALFVALAAALYYSYLKDVKDKIFKIYGTFNAPDPPEPVNKPYEMYKRFTF